MDALLRRASAPCRSPPLRTARACRHTDRGDGPEARGGGEPADVATVLKDRPSADEADAGDDLGGDARRIDIVSAAESISADDGEQRCSQGDQAWVLNPAGCRWSSRSKPMAAPRTRPIARRMARLISVPRPRSGFTSDRASPCRAGSATRRARYASGSASTSASPTRGPRLPRARGRARSPRSLQEGEASPRRSPSKEGVRRSATRGRAAGSRRARRTSPGRSARRPSGRVPASPLRRGGLGIAQCRERRPTAAGDPRRRGVDGRSADSGNPERDEHGKEPQCRAEDRPAGVGRRVELPGATTMAAIPNAARMMSAGSAHARASAKVRTTSIGVAPRPRRRTASPSAKRATATTRTRMAPATMPIAFHGQAPQV